ncbi:hypothetical protein F4780DRAFT_119213 [Xylariomycetidae sp. FL0641]|nr:hypothetical protein F4780DRAFT_119213 [Xylariomycetidae sp. FL0641]
MASPNDISGHGWQRSNANSRTQESSAPPPGTSTQQRQRNDESWVEVSSHPSSSSVSSIGDEIVTTGLQVGSAYGARRRRLHPQPYPHLNVQPSPYNTSQTAQHGTNSSQEEYDETESEEDHLLTSSTENINSPNAPRSTPLRQVLSLPPDDAASSEDDDEDDDENATALGRRPSEPFRPQPNAFTHPPSHLTHRHSTNSSIPQHATRPSFGPRSHTRVERRTPRFMSPRHQEDNDAALRASLTTLLSCAAAARGRSKDGEKDLGERAGPAGGGQPVELRFVPESELMAPSPTPVQGLGQSPSPRSNAASPPSSREAGGNDKHKRAAMPTFVGRSPRAAKKKKMVAVSNEETLISPTLLTWVVSAGVVVLVSVVGFGAGYVIGREVGRQETLNSLGSAGNVSSVADSGSCGREVMRTGGGTLKRFRWGSGVGKTVAA